MYLSDMDGEFFIRQAHALCLKVHVVMHTGSSDFQSIKPRAAEGGPLINAVLHKPFVDMQSLICIIINNLFGS